MEINETIKFVSDGFERAKAGEASETYNAIIRHPDMRVLPPQSHYPMGWIIYYALHQSPANAIKERKLLLAHYLRLNVAKPHKLHSMILNEAFRLYRDAADVFSIARLKGGFSPVTDSTEFSIVKFTELWNLAHIRPTDWNRKEHEGKQLSSTVEKLITHYTDELYRRRMPASDQFIAIVNQALVAYPPTSHIFAQRAQLHELAGENEAAIEMLRNAILTSSTKSYLWSRLANLITDKDKLRLRVALLHKALLCPGQEEFKGKIHLNLAASLAEGGALPQAKWELKHVRDLYKKNEWYLPKPYKETEKKIPSGTKPTDPSDIYRRVEHLADDFIYELLPDIAARKTYHKPAAETTDRYGNRHMGQTAWRVTDAGNTNYWFNPAKYGIPEDLPADTRVRIKVYGGKVVKAHI